MKKHYGAGLKHSFIDPTHVLGNENDEIRIQL